MIHTIAAEGLCGMEVVEVSPPYDVNDNTAQLACRVTLECQHRIVARHAAAVIGNADEPPPARFDLNAEVCGAGIE